MSWKDNIYASSKRDIFVVVVGVFFFFFIKTDVYDKEMVLKWNVFLKEKNLDFHSKEINGKVFEE